MRVLVACEESQIVARAFRELGHDAWSCDLQPGALGLPHIQDDVRNHLNDGWDLLIAHPVCKYLSLSGVRWRVARGEWDQVREAAEFFNLFLNAPIGRICVENPVQHKYAREFIVRYSQTIQPWQFGEGQCKRTCLWLKHLPPLYPTHLVAGRGQYVHRLPPSPDRAKLRSRTFDGVARAMAAQWGRLPPYVE